MTKTKNGGEQNGSSWRGGDWKRWTPGPKSNKRNSEKKKSNGNISGASSSRDSRKDDATNVCDSQMDKSKLNSLIGKRLLNGCNDDRGLKQKSIDSQSTVAAKTKLSNVHPKASPWALLQPPT